MFKKKITVTIHHTNGKEVTVPLNDAPLFIELLKDILLILDYKNKIKNQWQIGPYDVVKVKGTLIAFPTKEISNPKFSTLINKMTYVLTTKRKEIIEFLEISNLHFIYTGLGAIVIEL